MRLLALLLAVAAVGAPSADASVDGGVRRAAADALPLVERAAGAGLGVAAAAQAQYDAARALEGAVPPLRLVSPGCRPLARGLLGVAAGVVTAAEGVDRLDRGQVAAGGRRADATLAQVDRLHRTCRSQGRLEIPAQPDVIATPRAGEAFFGDVLDENYGAVARLYANGHLVRVFHSHASDLSFRLHLPPGRYDLELRFFRGGRLVWRSTAPDTYLLPATGRRARAAAVTDVRLQQELRRLGASFPGWAAIYTHDRRTGRAAGWNADARFPAASTVKLGVLAAVLSRWYPHVESPLLEPDLRALIGWSSNLAANRLLRLVGDGSETLGVERVEAALGRLGATSSRYPGPYRIGTSVDEQPPLATGRVTTARDLGRALYAISATASGDRAAARRTGLNEQAARYALRLLLESERSGANAGLLGGALAPGTPVAQKNGWITDVRDTAAIVYGPRGPRIVVVLAYGPGLTSAAATALGRQVVRAAF
ncbi:MAG: serine hydrolase [Gaiellaceae bacterium]